jgi:hypothetical protein
MIMAISTTLQLPWTSAQENIMSNDKKKKIHRVLACYLELILCVFLTIWNSLIDRIIFKRCML